MKNKKNKVLLYCLSLLLVGLFFCSAAVSDDFYKGKSIDIILPYSAGGGTDVMARFLGPWLTKFIPGNPSIVVRNMPGANGMIGANHVYNTAKKDGLTMMGGSGGNNLHSLLQLEGVEFDLKEMPMVMAASTGIIHYCKTGTFDKFEDIYDKEILIYGHLPAGGSQSTTFLMIKEILGFKTKKLLLAYGGSGDARRAFLRGEVNCTSDTALGYMGRSIKLEKEGEITILWQTGTLDSAGKLVKTDPPFGHIPTVYERYVDRYGKPPSGPVWNAYKALVAAVIVFDKSYVFPPGTPKERVKIVADACKRMVADPEFSKACQKKLKVELVVGEELQALFTENIVKADPDAVKWLKKWLREEFKVK